MSQPSIQQSFQLALQHHQAGRLPQAELIYRQILAQQPQHADALHLLGVIAHQAGRIDLAVDLIRRAIALNPNYPEAHYNLGNAQRDNGHLNEAITEYRRAIALKPAYPDAHNNLGIALMDKGRLDEAIAALRQAIALKPNYPQAHNNLGNAQRGKGRLDEAVAALRQAIALKPNYPQAHNNLGNALRDMGRLDDAIIAYHQAIAFNPNYPEAHNNLGNALKDKGQLDEAIAACRQAIALKPNFPEAYSNLGNALRDKGLLDEAVAIYRQALAHPSPFAKVIHSNLIYTLHFHPEHDARSIHEEHLRWNEQYAKLKPLKHLIQPHPNDRNPDRRLRIGYVSPHFFHQAEAFFVIPLLESHDHRNFEIHGYSSVVKPDDLTERFRRSFDVWHDVLGVPNVNLAETIRNDKIDILIDLTMHMSDNRLPLFALKPAPVQVTWLAYPGSTGLDTIDYRLTDACMDPNDDDAPFYAERSLRLPDAWCCYAPLIDVPPRPPQQFGPLTFGSLNNPCKMNPPLLELWCQLLQACPNSRLLLLANQGSHRQNLLHQIQQHHVDPARIEFVDRLSRRDYLLAYHRIDIALDTLPYNGITTTCDALWMGTPVITLTGSLPGCKTTAASRASASLLATIGLPGLIAHSPEQFITIATTLANDLPRLTHLRSTLRDRMQTSPLMDAKSFAHDIESAYREIWRHYCQSAK